MLRHLRTAWIGAALLALALLLQPSLLLAALNGDTRELTAAARADWPQLDGGGDMPERIAPVKFSRVIGSVAQTRVTLRLMRETANRSLYDPVVIEAAVNAVRNADGRDANALARELERYLRAHLDFLPDGLIQGEVLRSPRYLLDEIAKHGKARADCEDASMLTAALGKSVGVPARLVALAFFGPSEPFRHVFAELHTPRGWVAVDPTEPSRAGMRALPVTRRMELAV